MKIEDLFCHKSFQKLEQVRNRWELTHLAIDGQSVMLIDKDFDRLIENYSLLVEIHDVDEATASPDTETAPQLNWVEDWDQDDNSIWEANSFYVDDGSPIKWRLEPSLQHNKVIWVTDHDSELGGGDEWESLEEAKAAIQEQNDEIYRREMANAAIEDVQSIPSSE